jgi:hypothetical protein
MGIASEHHCADQFLLCSVLVALAERELHNREKINWSVAIFGGVFLLSLSMYAVKGERV